jgi:multiple sugar transport system permease protein
VIASTSPAGGGWNRSHAFATGLAPALVVLTTITLGPAIYLLVASLTPLDLINPQSAFDFSHPLGNYEDALTDSRFLNSVWVQTKLSAATVVLQLAAGLAVALLLNAHSRLLEAIRMAFLIPMVLPPIVVAIIWKVIYTPDVSPVHRALAAVGLPLGSLITNADTAIWAIVVADTWEWFPFTMLMTLAALQMIPNDPLEAAAIDGANRRQLFWYIVLPYVRPTLVVCGLFRLIDSIKAFPLIYVLTNGGPGTATEVTNYYGFVQAFNFSYWGYGSAIATMMVGGVFLLSLLARRLDTGVGQHE